MTSSLSIIFTTLNPYAKPTPKLTQEAKINVGCDILSSDTTRMAIDQGEIPLIPPTLTPPYEIKRNLYAKPARDYNMMEKYKWPPEVLTVSGYRLSTFANTHA